MEHFLKSRPEFGWLIITKDLNILLHSDTAKKLAQDKNIFKQVLASKDDEILLSLEDILRDIEIVNREGNEKPT